MNSIPSPRWRHVVGFKIPVVRLTSSCTSCWFPLVLLEFVSSSLVFLTFIFDRKSEFPSKNKQCSTFITAAIIHRFAGYNDHEYNMIWENTALLWQTSWVLRVLLHGDREQLLKFLWQLTRETEEACLCVQTARRERERENGMKGEKERDTGRNRKKIKWRTEDPLCVFMHVWMRLHLSSEQCRQDVKSWEGSCTEWSPGTPTA